ncbi:MAG TPA: hypothetical protein VGO55_15610 [Allosphingosinicella sp.]|nr:hypothetical protein [Allosphingosinicella sp.]
MSSGHPGRFDGVFGEGDSQLHVPVRAASRLGPPLAGLFGSRCTLVKSSDRKAPADMAGSGEASHPAPR